MERREEGEGVCGERVCGERGSVWGGERVWGREGVCEGERECGGERGVWGGEGECVWGERECVGRERGEGVICEFTYWLLYILAAGTWNLASSMPSADDADISTVNIPRILELDVNRMMYGQNQV